MHAIYQALLKQIAIDKWGVLRFLNNYEELSKGAGLCAN